MGVMDKFKSFIGVPDDEFYDEEDDFDFIGNRSNDRDDDYDDPKSRGAGMPDLGDIPTKKNKVVNIAATTQLQVVLVKPERFEDASYIADHLNDKRTVVLNLESASKEVSRRLIDFLSGVAYANEGQIKRVAASTYIITPRNVDFMGDLLGRAGKQWRILLICRFLLCPGRKTVSGTHPGSGDALRSAGHPQIFGVS